MAEFMSSDIK